VFPKCSCAKLPQFKCRREWQPAGSRQAAQKFADARRRTKFRRMLSDELAAHLNEPVLSCARKDVPLLRADMTVEGALAHIRQTGVGEKIIYFYVADADDKLLGVVPTRRLLVNTLDKPLRELMSPRVLAIPHTASLLEACEMFVLHKFLAFPIVDSERRVCGVIDISFFAAQVFEMSEDQPFNDIFEAIGLHVEQLRNASPATQFRFRFPWLLGTIASGTTCAFLSGAFEVTLANAITIAFFVPLVLGLNESVAMQSMSLSLQSLHQGKHRGLLLSRLRRELKTASLLALAACLIVGTIAAVWRQSLPAALVVAGTILASVIVAALVGFGIPVLLRLGKRDPRLASGPVALAVVDVLALLLYFTVATIVFT
jgi:magnesium transporter